MKLATIQAFVAPLAAPAAPALLLAAEVNRVLLGLEVNFILALVVSAVGVFLGVEASGALSFYMAVEAWRRQRWGMMWLAILAALVYVGIIVGAILLIPGEVTVVVAVLAMAVPIAYFGTAMYMALRREDETQTVSFERQMEQARQQRLLINAQTRHAKAVQLSTGQTGQQTGHPGQSNGQAGQAESTGFKMTSLGLAIFQELDSDAKQADREIARKLDCSPTTVSTWRFRWDQER